MKTTKLKMIDEVTSQWLKRNLTKKDKLAVCEKTNMSYAYISMILNQERYSDSVVLELTKKAEKNEKAKSKKSN